MTSGINWQNLGGKRRKHTDPITFTRKKFRALSNCLSSGIGGVAPFRIHNPNSQPLPMTLLSKEMRPRFKIVGRQRKLLAPDSNRLGEIPTRSKACLL
jgi:hypothetical protein